MQRESDRFIVTFTLIVHIVVSIIPGTHLHLSQVKHLRVTQYLKNGPMLRQKKT